MIPVKPFTGYLFASLFDDHHADIIIHKKCPAISGAILKSINRISHKIRCAVQNCIGIFRNIFPVRSYKCIRLMDQKQILTRSYLPGVNEDDSTPRILVCCALLYSILGSNLYLY